MQLILENDVEQKSCVDKHDSMNGQWTKARVSCEQATSLYDLYNNELYKKVMRTELFRKLEYSITDFRDLRKSISSYIFKNSKFFMPAHGFFHIICIYFPCLPMYSSIMFV